MTDADREILTFASAQRLILAQHVQALLDTSGRSSRKRLADLTKAGLLSHHPAFHAQPGRYQITPRGLAAIDSQLPAPRYELIYNYRHDIGVAWLTLHAMAGKLGPHKRVLTERELRSHDTASAVPTQAPAPAEPTAPVDRRESRFGVRVGEDDLAKPTRVHYPDLMLVVEQGRVAIELQTAPPGRVRLETIIAGYGADRNIAGALYLVNDDKVARIIQAAATRRGLSATTHVQNFQYGKTTPTRSIAE